MINNNVITSKYNSNGIFLRGIHSFISRRRKLSNNKYDVIHNNWSKFGINFKLSHLNFNQVFSSNLPIVLEIGFGIGDSFSKIALNNLSNNFLGIEVYLPGIISCLQYINLYRLSNVRIIYYDAVEVLKNMISDKSLSSIQIFFPDPWPKKRHQKRRIFTKDFAKLILKKLISNGTLYVSTDCRLYAEEIITIMNNMKEYTNLFYNNSIFRSTYRPITKFEKRGIRLGNTIFDLGFKLA